MPRCRLQVVPRGRQTVWNLDGELAVAPAGIRLQVQPGDLQVFARGSQAAAGGVA
jgi:hypothetical protein